MMDYVNRDGRYGYCWCGCGQKTHPSTYTNKNEYVKKGEPTRFLKGHHVRKPVRYIEEDRGHETPCWIWQLKVASNGYPHITINGETRLAHRHYYEQFEGPIPDDLTIDHRCNITTCVNPSHLEPVTLAVNQRRSSKTVLSEQMVRMLKEANALGATYKQLAAVTDIKPRTIRAAVNGENWQL